MAKVSVVMPVYNGEKYLRPCLDSVVNQTLRDIEIICVDDGSTDGSPAVLEQYRKMDSRIQILRSENAGAGAARNLGLGLARGEYLAFLDCDDLFDPEMLEAGWRKAKAENADVVIFRARQLDMGSGKTQELKCSLQMEKCPLRSPFPPRKMAKYLFNSFENWTWNKLFRREFIQKNKIVFQQLARTNDMAFTCQALALAERISILPRTLVTYRVGTGTSLQQTNHRSPTCFWEAYRETRRRLEEAGLYETYRRSLVNAVLQGALYNLRSVRTEEARREILGLLKERSREFGLNSCPARYFYSQKLYREYRSALGMAEKGSDPGRFANKLPRPVRSFYLCCADHGLAYTLGISVKKIIRVLIQK